MKAVTAGAIVGLLISGVIVAFGSTGAAWIGITLAALAIVRGAVDYVRTR